MQLLVNVHTGRKQVLAQTLQFLSPMCETQIQFPAPGISLAPPGHLGCEAWMEDFCLSIHFVFSLSNEILLK